MQITGCLFHYSQSLYRKVVELGYKRTYHLDAEFSLLIRCLCALAFLPVADVIEGFEELVDQHQEIPQEIVSYVETYYIGGLRGR